MYYLIIKILYIFMMTITCDILKISGWSLSYIVHPAMSMSANFEVIFFNGTLPLAQGWVQIHIWGSNTNTTQANQIQIHCFSKFQFK